jgi:hypothetical protein
LTFKDLKKRVTIETQQEGQDNNSDIQGSEEENQQQLYAGAAVATRTN